MKKISVVIPNFNYGDYVAQAVESALRLDWPNVEVVVVDDGSTDQSIAILETFGQQITFVRQRNSGPRVACNTGFKLTTGDAVIFLDSDDVLEPNLAREVAAVWSPDVSKVQVQMSRIDGSGSPAGRDFPDFRSVPTTDEIRHWLVTTSAYPTPPGSGNVYSRWFLDQLLPLDDRCGDSTDSACLAAAPMLGSVVTVPRPLVRYRVHGENRSRLGGKPERFVHQLNRAEQRQRFCLSLLIGPQNSDVVDVQASLRRGRHILQMRVSHFRISQNGPAYSWDTFSKMMLDCARAPFSPGPESPAKRAVISLWCTIVLLAPAAVGRRLIGARFN